MTKNRKKLPKREEIPLEARWRLEDLYPDDAAWEADWQKAKDLLGPVAAYAGHLREGAETLLACLRAQDELGEILERLYVYAHMRRDEDNTNPTYQALLARAEALNVEAAGATAFLVPEIVALGAETIKSFLAEEPQLRLYTHFLEDVLRTAAHTLSPAEEKLLALAGEVAEGPRNIFTLLNNADLRFPTIKNEAGEEVELTKGNYLSFMESRDRRVRQEAFTALYQAYGRQINTLAATLATSVKKDIFYARARRYPSALAAALDGENIPLSVYEELLATVRAKLAPLHAYLDLRRQVLGLPELHMFDLHVPLAAEVEWHIPYEEALALVKKGLAPLGEEYGQVLEEAFRSRWLDVWENEGKTSGAYSWGAYGIHPYVLLNYEENLNGLFTIAHEMGHALHTYYSNRSQPFIYAHYTIFVAEVASTVNEVLLMQHLLETTTDPRRRVYILGHFLEEFRGTVYRQTHFAEFEKRIHEDVEAGRPLTRESLAETYRQLLADYYGPGVVLDPEISLEWARIPHFYTAFYVYKYATGFAAAVALAQAIREEGAPAVARYLEFLQSGSSAYPVELLQRAGVDMTTPIPVARALDYFATLVEEMRASLAQLGQIR